MIHETCPNNKMGYGMAEFEHQSINYRLESLTINEEEFIKSSVPEIVKIYNDPTKRGINNVKVTASDDLTREGLQSKFRDLVNQLYDNGNDKVKCKDFPGLEQALKNARGEIPEYLESIAIQIEKDRGETTEFVLINIQILVCAAIKEMEDFSVGDLDWDTLKKWGATLNYAAEKFGFQVRFADNLLKEKLLAYFAVQNLYKSTAKK